MPHLQSRPGGNFSIRWHEERLSPDGSLVTVHASKAIGKFRSARTAKSAMAELLPSIAAIPRDPQSTMQVADFIEHCFLPAAKNHLSASTHYGYCRLYAEHRDLLPAMPLRDVRCVHGQQFIDRVHAAKGLGKNSLHNIKSWMSAAFKYACRMGVVDSNPMRDIALPRAAATKETAAYSLQEVAGMIQSVPGRASVVIAVAAYTGLRKGEIAALKWDDFDGTSLHVRRAKWMNTISEPKTAKSKAPVPVIKPLADILEDWRGTQGVRGEYTGEWMFGPEPLDMDQLEAKEIAPFTKLWKGWHAARRGLATTLKQLGVDDLVIQRILRHSNVAVTQSCYVKTSSVDAVAAMQKLGEQIAVEARS